MARFRTVLYFSLAAVLLLAPSATFAAGYFGPIIPQSGTCFCDGGPLDWGCVLQVIQNLIRLAVSLGVIMCVVWTALGGFQLIVSRGNPEAISTAKARFLNSLIGIAVILCAWIIVNFVMVAIYDPNAAFSGKKIGPWNDILAGNGDDYCIRETTPEPITSGALTSVVKSNGSVVADTGGVYGGTGAQCSPSNQACSVSTLQGKGLSSTQANVMSCIAMTESSGVPGTPPYNQAHPGSNSTACGTFQITQTTWKSTASGSCQSFSNCMNASCNAQVAATLVKKSGYSSWTCPGCNNKAQGCVTKYGG